MSVELNTPFMGIATQSTKGVARGAKVEGMKNEGFVKTRKVAHVGMFELREVLDKANRALKRKGHPYFANRLFFEKENLAEFDGPMCIDACRDFIALLKSGRTRSSGVTCKADGAATRVKLWKKLASVEEVAP